MCRQSMTLTEVGAYSSSRDVRSLSLQDVGAVEFFCSTHPLFDTRFSGDHENQDSPIMYLGVGDSEAQRGEVGRRPPKGLVVLT
jgi:hypothetical protein